jgi:large repetitive protein
MTALQCARRFGLIICAVLLAACSNGRGSVEEGQQQTQPATFTVGGAVSGLSGSGLVLQINGAGDLAVTGNGAFTFAGGLADGASYDVTIRSQPANPAQTCTVSSGAGRISAANVSSVAVVCAEGSTSFTVGGSVTGLTGSGLILRNNGAEDLPISADGEFIFPTPVATGAAYAVTVAQSPTNPAQTCSIENGSGVMGSGDVTSVRVICSAQAFTVGGTVTGLAAINLRLRNNDEVIAIGADGPFTFTRPVASGAAYNVTIESNPQGQNCIIANGGGVVQNANIDNVVVTCSSNSYGVGGSIVGLTGGRLTLVLDAAGVRSEFRATQSGSFVFDRLLADGTAYVVEARPHQGAPAHSCRITNAAGVVRGGPVSNVQVTCELRQFRIGGQVEQLQGSGLTLFLNGGPASGGQERAIVANGEFSFPTPLNSGAAYEVTIAAQPGTPPQTCSVANGGGTVGAADVTNVRVTCALTTFTIGGAVTGLTSGSVVLQNNGGDALEVAADGAFTFPARIATGGAYAVTVRTQPAGHMCSVANGAGTVAAANITNVAVSCQRVYTVGGTVSGLAGSGLTLRNGDATLAVSGGSFRFPQALTSGAAYNVTVEANPSNPSQTCSVTNGAGTVGAADVTNIEVACSTNAYTIGGQVTGLQGLNLQLQNNGGDTLPIFLNGGFTFAAPVLSGQPYNVTVSRQPDPLPFLPPQTCTVTSGSGTVGGGNVADIVVTCQ